jgi:hypothetical protein
MNYYQYIYIYIMPKRTRKYKKRGKRKTRRKGRRRRSRRRRRRRRQRGGSEAYDALHKEMFQAIRVNRETEVFPSPSSGQLALFDPTQCPNANYRTRNFLNQEGYTCWMWSVVLLLLNLSSPPISFPLNTLVKTYLIHLEYLLKSSFDGCPMIPGWLRAVASKELRTKTALTASYIENTRFSAGEKEHMEVPVQMNALSFLLLLLKAAGYTVRKNVKYFDDDDDVIGYSPDTAHLNNADGKPSVVVAVLLLSDLAGQCVEIVAGGKATKMFQPCTSHDDCDEGMCWAGEKGGKGGDAEHAKTDVAEGARRWRIRVLTECWKQRKRKGRAENIKVFWEKCQKEAQRQVFAENVLWRWLFTKNAKNVLGGLLTVRWMSGEEVMTHSMAFYRCGAVDEVRIYICNTWGRRCSLNDVNAEEFHDFLGGAFWGNAAQNILITRITCIVAEKTPVVRGVAKGGLTRKEKGLNELGERVRQEFLGEK